MHALDAWAGLRCSPSQQVSEGPNMVAFHTKILSSWTGAADAPCHSIRRYLTWPRIIQIPILQQHPSSFPSSRTAVGVVRNSCRTKVSRSRTQFIQEENSKPKRSYSRQIQFWWLLDLCCYGAQRIYAGAPRSPPPMVILYRGGTTHFCIFCAVIEGGTQGI
jgi:hypothetical protein